MGSGSNKRYYTYWAGSDERYYTNWAGSESGVLNYKVVCPTVRKFRLRDLRTLDVQHFELLGGFVKKENNEWLSPFY